jgi:hypothetical protein
MMYELKIVFFIDSIGRPFDVWFEVGRLELIAISAASDRRNAYLLLQSAYFVLLKWI